MSNHATDDYEKIRANLYTMLDDAIDALALSKEILRESEHPRAVETYSGLLNNVVKLNAQILDLSKTHRDITERKNYKDSTDTPLALSDGSPQPAANVYIGTTADLQQMLKKARIEDAALVDVTPDAE